LICDTDNTVNLMMKHNQ